MTLSMTLDLFYRIVNFWSVNQPYKGLCWYIVSLLFSKILAAAHPSATNARNEYRLPCVKPRYEINHMIISSDLMSESPKHFIYMHYSRK